MLAKVLSSTITGIDAIPVEVEVKACPGPNRFTIIGLADNAVKESRDRVISAISHSGFSIPEQVLVSLSPAELKKEGSAFDLPIAIGVLVASRQVPSTMLKRISFHGELSLDGQIKKITGALAYATRSAQLKIPYIVLPAENARESKILNSIQTVGVHSLQEIALFLKSESIPILNIEAPATEVVVKLQDFQDFSDVCGQDSAKRALLIAAS
ncbi:MAG: ATP-binding protein [SAR324 cluster bacterium]|uniref:ATP-binding protein n=1 Tax=SAR324 cluster bacterium TaxID=2024889 RepID=A0A7X9FTZ3_9DELT|nr:ATP-binding protein [SAR324 cluster bacterium]